MGSFLGSPYRGNTESGRVDHRLQELLVLEHALADVVLVFVLHFVIALT